MAYAGVTSLFCPIYYPQIRSFVATQLNADLDLIISWCQRWGIKLNPGKTSNTNFSRSKTADPPHPDISLPGHDHDHNLAFIFTHHPHLRRDH